jgi:DNA-binding CsgD family transcriptional regulator
MGKAAEMPDSDIQNLLNQLRVECAAIDAAIANAEAPGPGVGKPLLKPRIAAAVAREGIIIVDAHFKPMALDNGARAILNILGGRTGTSPGPISLPAEIFDLLRAQAVSDLALNYVKLSGRGSEFSCRSFLMRPTKATPAEHIFALHLKREVPLIETIRRVGRDYNLTTREQEALLGVSMGLTSKELAKRMGVSPNTVKAFLHLIMVKMGATNRAGVVGKLLDRKTGY